MSGLIPHNGHQSGGNSVFDVGSTPAKTIHIIPGNRRFCRSQTPNTRDSASGTRPADGLQPASGTGKRRHIVCCRMPKLIQSRWRGWCDGVACGKGVNGWTRRAKVLSTCLARLPERPFLKPHGLRLCRSGLECGSDGHARVGKANTSGQPSGRVSFVFCGRSGRPETVVPGLRSGLTACWNRYGAKLPRKVYVESNGMVLRSRDVLSSFPSFSFFSSLVFLHFLTTLVFRVSWCVGCNLCWLGWMANKASEVLFSDRVKLM